MKADQVLIDEILTRHDQDDDDFIDYGEFKQMMLSMKK